MRGVMVKLSFIGILLCLFAFNANAAVKVKNDTAMKSGGFVQSGMGANNNAGASQSVQYDPAEEARIIETLENDIRLIDAELETCERKKKGWIAATVIGSVGVVSTGVAAAVQGAKISDKKSTAAEKEQTLKNLKQESNQLDQ